MDPRKRKRLLLSLAIGSLLLVILFLVTAGESEPSYNGRSLTQWMQIRAGSVGVEADPAARFEAPTAYRAIGTNALPYLLEWITYETAPWRYRVGRLAERLPAWLTGGLPLVRLTSNSKGEMRALMAMEAFMVLGPIAEPLLPELEQLLQRTNSPGVPERALFALAGIGSAAVPIMTNALVQPHFAGTQWVMVCIDHMGTNARAFTPIIASQLTHTDRSLAENTASSFIQLGPTTHFDAELLVPALIQCLQDPRSSMRAHAVFSLRIFGPAAAPALPALTNALSDPDPQVRAAASAAIKIISGVLPEELRIPMPSQ